MHLEIDVHRSGFLIALDLGVFGLEHFEIAELIQAKKADFPQAIVKEIAFIKKNFAANNLVASGGVAGEINAADEELFALVEAEASD